MEIDSRTPAMMRPNPPKIAHSPLVSHSSPSFLALTKAVTTTPATMLANPRRGQQGRDHPPASFPRLLVPLRQSRASPARR